MLKTRLEYLAERYNKLPLSRFREGNNYERILCQLCDDIIIFNWDTKYDLDCLEEVITEFEDIILKEQQNV